MQAGSGRVGRRTPPRRPTLLAAAEMRCAPSGFWSSRPGIRADDMIKRLDCARADIGYLIKAGILVELE
jgi:hypothetical protein